MENKITIGSIIDDSVFGIVGTIKDQTSIDLFVAYLSYNKPVLNYFQDIILSLNGDRELLQQIPVKVEPLIKNNLHILTSENLGHTFGTFLLDAAIFSYSKQLPQKYVWKFSNDIIVQTSILDKIITKNHDFYYINNIGYNVFNTYSRDELIKVLMDQKFYYPQTNYYIIKNHINFYPEVDEVYNLKQKYEDIRNKNPGIQPWHAIEGCDCEHMLARTVQQNNLSKEHLLSENSTKKIIEHIYNHKIYDGSHKNIAYSELGNLCHLQFPNDPIFYV